jgi:hypothetical protein
MIIVGFSDDIYAICLLCFIGFKCIFEKKDEKYQSGK